MPPSSRRDHGGGSTDDSVLELATRRRIYTYVVDHPGSYLREIQRALDMTMGSLEYHLGQLVEAGLVTVQHEENKRFFPARMDASERRPLSLLRQEAVRRIAAALLVEPESPHKDLAAATGLGGSTLSYYLAKLAEAGLVTSRRDGRTTRYALTDPARVHRLLVRYRATFLDRILDAFLDGFDAVRLPGPAPEEDDAVDRR